MACDCHSEMDALLAAKNARLPATVVFPRTGGPSFVLPSLMVEKIDPRGKRPPVVVPSFCPFCGTRYAAAERLVNASVVV